MKPFKLYNEQTEAVIQRCSVKKMLPKLLQNSQEQHLHQSLPFNKATSQRPATLLKNRPWYRSSPCESCKPPENTHLHRTSPVAVSKQIKKSV